MGLIFATCHPPLVIQVRVLTPTVHSSFSGVCISPWISYISPWISSGGRLHVIVATRRVHVRRDGAVDPEVATSGSSSLCEHHVLVEGHAACSLLSSSTILPHPRSSRTLNSQGWYVPKDALSVLSF